MKEKLPIDFTLSGIQKSKIKVSVITGSGIDAEAGLPTFRGEKGYYEDKESAYLASIDALKYDPIKQWDWYLRRFAIYKDTPPSFSHKILAKLEKTIGNKFLGNIRETDAIIHVIRCFDDNEIIHVDGSINPLRDKEAIELELQLKDLESVSKKLSKIERASNSGDKDAQREYNVLNKIIDNLNESRNVRSIELSEGDRLSFIKPLQLLTDKPILYVCNVSENDVVSGNDYVQMIQKSALQEGAEVIFLGVKIEADINDLETYEERQLFIEDLGLNEPGSARLIKSVYKLLSLHTFFTVGENEVRAWTITANSNAQEAAGVIHTDFAKGFIRAEVSSYSDYKKYKSDTKVKEAGKMRVEGKDYVVKDGDIIYFRFNV